MAAFLFYICLTMAFFAVCGVIADSLGILTGYIDPWEYR